MGKKFVIELEDSPLYKPNGDRLYAVKNFDGLLLDDVGVSKLEAYEKDTPKYHVGDEVIVSITTGFKGFVRKVDGANIFVTGEDFCGMYHAEDLTKTGRHFPEIANVFKKMRDD